MTEVRNRIINPSINFPESEDEAFQALVKGVRRGCFDRAGTFPGLLNRHYTTDAGLGQRRTQESADWLNHQQSLIRARLEDFLDGLDLEFRITDETTKETT